MTYFPPIVKDITLLLDICPLDASFIWMQLLKIEYIVILRLCIIILQVPIFLTILSYWLVLLNFNLKNF